MINYGYFRHRFDASNDPKLQGLIDEMGIAALGYYYSLLELYGHNFASLDDKKEVEIHRRVLANTWRKRVDSCDLVLTKFQLSGLLVYTKLKNTYVIDIPNFLKYYGSYKKTTTQNSPNKRKEKKIKENKNKKNKIKKNKKNTPSSKLDNPSNLWLDETQKIINHLNSKTHKQFKTNSTTTKRCIAARLSEGFNLEDFLTVIDSKTSEWLHDPKMSQYLRPQTLFGTKFESYLNNAQCAFDPDKDLVDFFNRAFENAEKSEHDRTKPLGAEATLDESIQ